MYFHFSVVWHVQGLSNLFFMGMARLIELLKGCCNWIKCFGVFYLEYNIFRQVKQFFEYVTETIFCLSFKFLIHNIEICWPTKIIPMPFLSSLDNLSQDMLKNI